MKRIIGLWMLVLIMLFAMNAGIADALETAAVKKGEFNKEETLDAQGNPLASEKSASGSGPAPAAEAVPRLTLLSERTMRLTQKPADGAGLAAAPLPDGSLLVAYDAVDGETAVSGRQRGTDGGVTQNFELFDEMGNSVWCGAFREHEAEEDSAFTAIVVEQDGFVIEQYDSPELDRCQAQRFALDGESLGVSDQLLTDDEKHYTTNAYPFQVKVYPFGESANVPVEIRHLPSGSRADDSAVYGAPLCVFPYQNRLLVIAGEEQGGASCRIYDGACHLLSRQPALFDEGNIGFIAQGGEALFVFANVVDSGVDAYAVYPLDKETGVLGEAAGRLFCRENQVLDGAFALDGGFLLVMTQVDASGDETSGLYFWDEKTEPILLETLNQCVSCVYPQEAENRFSLLVYDMERGECAVRTYAAGAV